MKTRNFYKLNIILLLFLCVFYPVKSFSAPAPIATNPCDSNYYATLSARAWLEAQREITQNQNLILKPDSVFEYTCFDLFLRELADHAANMLSETGSYGSPLSTTSMDTALQNLIGTSLIQYVNLNFETPGYDLLGGHPAATGIDHVPSAITGGTYSCNIMNRVWMAAKCINFVTNSATDGFYTFQEYTTGLDKRHLPSACTPVTAAFATNLTTALGVGPWVQDPVQTYYANTAPPTTCTGTCSCSGTPVPTGIYVYKSGETPYQEHICLQAGCRYHGGGTLYVDSGGTAHTAAAGCYGR